MPYRTISRDLKLAAINLYEKDLIPLDNILDCVGFSERNFYQILNLWRATGEVIKHSYGLWGRSRHLVFDDVQYFLWLVHHRPDWFLDELADLLTENRFIAVHFTTIHCELARYGYSTKKLRRIAAERSEEKWPDFVYRMGVYNAKQLGFIDETSKDEKTPGRRRGQAKKGQRAQCRQVFVCGHRLSGTGLLTVDGMVMSMVVQGSMTTASFCEFLEENVVCTFLLDNSKHMTTPYQLPLCSPFPGKLSVLVIDNARIHHGEGVRELIESRGEWPPLLKFSPNFFTGVRLKYLPPYSPDLNPIEEAFSKIKAFIRQNCDIFLASTGGRIMFDLLEAMAIITVDDTREYFLHAGY